MIFMGRKSILMYIFFSLTLFIALAGLFCFRVLETRQENFRRSAETFEPILHSLEAACRIGRSFDSREFKQAVERAFSSQRDLRVLSVHSVGAGRQYVHARSSRDLSASPGPRGPDQAPPGPALEGFSRAKITLPMKLDDARPYLLEGVFRVVREEDIYRPLRDTVLVLVVFSVLTSTLTILLRAFGVPEPAARGKLGMPAVRRRVPAGMSDSPISGKPDFSAVSGGGNPPSAGPAAALPGRVEDFSPDASDCAPSPSGIGYQRHLEKRLTLEQERSAFNEQDMSLALLRFPGLSRKEEDYRLIAREIQGRMAFEDLVFEFGDDGYAVILPNSNLDESMTTVRNFLKTLQADLVRRHPAPLCGLTSRNGRIVDGARLLLEGSRALGKAGPGEPDNIVGFRPDPGKYRQYVSKHGPS